MAVSCPCRRIYFKQTSATCSRKFTHLEKNIIYAIYLEELIVPTNDLDVDTEEFEESNLNDKWNLFWSSHGNEIVLRTWKSKYKDHLDPNYVDNSEDFIKSSDDDSCSVNTDNTQIDFDNEDCYCNLIKLDDILNIIRPESISEVLYFNDLSIDDDDDWNTLWEKHYEIQYKVNYAIFLEIFSSLSEVLDFDIKQRNTCCIGNMNPDYESSSGDAELEALGLPTSFGKKRRKRSLTDSSKDNYKKNCLTTTSAKVSIDLESSSHLIETVSTCEKGEKEEKGEENDEMVTSFEKTSGEEDVICSSSLGNVNSKTLSKYRKKRFSLFSRFDEGIKLDAESWFSVTPEKIAIHIAKRLKCPLIVDAFCGSGGNTIQFAFTCKKVIAIDIDPVKVSLAKHNAKIYGVEKNIEFIIGDFFSIYHHLSADVIFLSPPWGGPGYGKISSYDIEKDLLPVPATQLLETCRKITSNICLYLPKNSDIEKVHKTCGKENKLEIETSYLNRRPVALTVYYGDLVR